MPTSRTPAEHRLAPSTLERLVALFVVAVVAWGVGAKIYEGYADRRTQAYFAYHDMLWDHWTIELVGDDDDVAAAIAADDRVPITHAALEEARREAEAAGIEFLLLREWSAAITNPETGARVDPLESRLQANFEVRAIQGENPDTPSVLVDGALPTAPAEIALSTAVVAKLGLGFGDAVRLSHPDRSATADYTLVGTLQPRASWGFPYDANVFAVSEAPTAIVSWEGSDALYEAAKGFPPYPTVVVNWNGDSPAFDAISIIVAGPGGADEHQIASDMGADRLASGALLVGIAGGPLLLTAAWLLGPAAAGRRRWLRLGLTGLGGTVAGYALAVIVSLAIHGAVALRVPDLVQPSFGLPALPRVWPWLLAGIASAAAVWFVSALRGRLERRVRERPRADIGWLGTAILVAVGAALGSVVPLATGAEFKPQWTAWYGDGTVSPWHGAVLFGLFAFIAVRTSRGRGAPTGLGIFGVAVATFAVMGGSALIGLNRPDQWGDVATVFAYNTTSTRLIALALAMAVASAIWIATTARLSAVAGGHSPAAALGALRVLLTGVLGALLALAVLAITVAWTRGDAGSSDGAWGAAAELTGLMAATTVSSVAVGWAIGLALTRVVRTRSEAGVGTA